jgi:hypothetical protein
MSALIAAIEIGRPRIEPELSSRRVTIVSRKLGVALDLVGQAVLGIDDDAGEPGRIEQPFLLVEVPAARLLRHQPPLQAVGELGDRALEMDQLLVEIGAQPPQFLFVAQFSGGDDLVILVVKTR